MSTKPHGAIMPTDVYQSAVQRYGTKVVHDFLVHGVLPARYAPAVHHYAEGTDEVAPFDTNDSNPLSAIGAPSSTGFGAIPQSSPATSALGLTGAAGLQGTASEEVGAASAPSAFRSALPPVVDDEADDYARHAGALPPTQEPAWQPPPRRKPQIGKAYRRRDGSVAIYQGQDLNGSDVWG